MTAMPINETVPVIKGLALTNEELKRATDNGDMLLMDIETSNICNLNCLYCFRNVYGTKEKLKNELSLEERLNLIRQAKELGCKTLKVTGAGEPLIDEYFIKMVEYANSLGMNVMAFTNGMIIDKNMAKKLFDLGVSLIVKCNSMNPEIEDKMTGLAGYCEKRNKALQYLMEVGFNKTKPTRLGMDAVITQLNKDEILKSFEFCRKNNIFPLFRPMMPIGAAINKKDWEISKEETEKLYKEASEIDKKKFNIIYEPKIPYMGGVWCRQLQYAMYVNILGEAYPCTGSKRLLGKIRETPLKEIWNSDLVKKIRSTPYDGCPLREKNWKGEVNIDCV